MKIIQKGMITLSKSSQFYEKHLRKYFDKHYWTYEAIAEFYTNPDDRTWRFYIPILEVEVFITCNDDGQIIENKRELTIHGI